MLRKQGDFYTYQPPALTPDIIAALRKLPPKDLAFSNLMSYACMMMPGYKVARHNVLLAEHLMAVERGEIQRLMVFMPPRHGKGFSDDTNVLTPSGWTTHGALQPGDYVFGPDGKPTLITFRSDELVCDTEVELTSGEVLKVNREHLWTVYDRRSVPQVKRTLETQEMAKDFWIGEKNIRGGRARWQLPDYQTLVYPEKKLLIHPYALGAWLGDGNADRQRIAYAACDREIIDTVISFGYLPQRCWTQEETGVMYVDFNLDLKSQLREIGVLGKKHIPESYLRSSIKQRLELLAGLIDTDGSVEAKTGRVRFSTTTKALRDGVFDLVVGLGFRPYITEAKPCTSSSNIVGRKIVYQICFQPSMSFPTRLPRKSIKKFSIRRKVAIRDIRPAKIFELGHCIKVDREDGLYLVGRKLTVTHNTAMASELFPSWFMGRNPKKQIIATTYSHDRATDVGRVVRDYMLDPMYQEIFAGSNVSSDSKSAHKIGFDEGGNYYSVGVGGAIVGRGAHVFLIDDPIKSREEAESEVVQRKLRNWYRSVAYTRLMPGKSAIVIILTRWSFYDLPGWLQQEQKQEDWVVLELPAVADSDNDAIGRLQGEALWPSEYPLPKLEAIKRAVGAREWNSQYQQKPLPEEGGLVHLDWFKTYSPKDLHEIGMNTNEVYNKKPNPNNSGIVHQVGKSRIFIRLCDRPRFFVKIICSWDTAFKPNELNDPSACTIWGVTNDNKYFLLWVFNKRVEYPDLVVNAKIIWKRNYEAFRMPKSRVCILVEDKASGQSLIQELRRSVKAPVLDYQPRFDKTMRFSSVTDIIKGGRVWLPENAPWMVDYLTQIAQFPLAKHDDMVDSTSQFLDYMNKDRPRKPRTPKYWK